MPSITGFAATFVLAALLPFSASAADVYEYNFQSSYAGPHVLNVHMYQPSLEKIEKQTDGKLKIHFFMSGAITKPEEVVPGVINGNLDMAGAGSLYQDSMMPITHSLELPHITRDSVQASALYWKAYTTIPEVKAELDKLGKVLTVWGSDRSGLFSSKGPITSPADIAGKRVLVWGGGQVDQIKAWGGIPVQVSPNDTYLGLQRGMGDVFFGPLPVGVAYKLLEVAKDVTILPATTVLVFTIVNWDVWNELPAEYQQMLMDELGGEKNSIRSGALLYEYTNKDLNTMRAAGCAIHELNDAQYKAFRDADHDVTMKFWRTNLARLRVADPEAVMKRNYDMAAAIPGAK